MADDTQGRLASYLDLMGKEELKEFQRQLCGKPPDRPPTGPAPTRGPPAGGMEVASQLVAQDGEQRAWDVAVRTCQAQAEAALTSDPCSLFPCSPSAPSEQSPSGPASTQVLKFVVQGPETMSSRQRHDTFGRIRRNPEPDLVCPGTFRGFHQGDCSSFYQALPNSPEQESPLQESPSAPTSTAVLRDWASPAKPSPKPRKQEAPRAGWILGETSGHHVTEIREKYQLQKRKKPCPTESWGNEDLHPEFIELLLLHQSHPRHQESLSKWSWHRGAVRKQGQLIEVKDLFGPGLGAQKKPQIVILHGVAGVGKSTMARQVRRAWEEGRLYRDHFQHIFYFSYRELAQSDMMSLEELITKDRAASVVPTKQILSQPGQLLFIFDDLDELKWPLGQFPLHQSQRQPVEMLLWGFLAKAILPEASLLITVRTTALESFFPPAEQPRWVEILGFSESGRKDYFYKYFKNEREADRAFRSVEANQALLTLCLVPMASWLVCTCLKKQMEQGEALSLASQTATGLCLHYLSQALPAQPPGTRLTGLCSLAAKGVRQGKSVFIGKDLRKHSVGEAAISALVKSGVLQKHPSSRTYRFAHWYLQEFFAAVSWVLRSKDKRSHPLESTRKLEHPLSGHGRFDLGSKPTTCFALGLLNEPGQRELEAVFQGKVPRKRRGRLLRQVRMAVCEEPPELRQCSWPMLHCLYEIQNKDFLTREMSRFHGASVCVRTDPELLVFMFCIKFCNVKKLKLDEGGWSGHQWRSASVNLLSGAPVTDAWWRVLSFTLRATGNLKELDLSGNHLSRSAVQSLCEALKFPSCHLEALWLAHCGLKAESCKDLASVLSASQTLTKLELSFNPLQDPGAEHLCEGLRQPGCRLHQLQLVSCGLTSSCCQALASMLSTSPSLTNLDLQQNELEDVGVRLLCEGLRHPTCQLKLLCLDQTQLSEEVTQTLRALEEERPPLVIGSRWKPSEMPNEGPSEGETSSTSSLKPERQGSGLESHLSIHAHASCEPRSSHSDTPLQLGPEQLFLTEGISPGGAQEELCSLPLPDDPHTEPLETEDHFWGPLGPVATEAVDKDKNLYRVRLPRSGSYRWPNTGLRFVVRRPVTIYVELCASDKFLHEMAPKQGWMVAGPLFDIKAEPGAVATVYLPHFVDLRGGYVDTSLFQVAHFKEEGLLLEKPARVELQCVVLEDPSFSPIGVFLRTIHTALRFLPITALVLLYHHARPDEIAFHLYLIPSDCCIRKAIDDEEKAFQFVQIRKPPPMASLYLGSRYTVSGSEKLEAIPKELELCYRSPGEPQLFSEFYVGHLGSGLRLRLRDRNGLVVWEALVKSGDLRRAASWLPPAAAAGAPASLHFVDQHREQLVARVTSVDPMLDKLLGQVLSEEQYERVRAQATASNQMRELFSFSRSWDWACKDQVYQALKETHPYLIMDLWEMWGGGGERGASPPAQ